MVNKILRFVEIDINYLKLPISIQSRLLNIINTNITIFFNLLFNKHEFSPINLSGKNIYYDTPYATKTFLTGSFDFYSEIEKGKIFKSESPLIVDVGSNIGQYLYSIKQFYPNARVVCFEPDPIIYKILKKNISNFKKVKSYNLALSNRNKIVEFYVSNEFSEWSSLHKINDKMTRIQVVAKKGDDVLKDIPQIDLLKIDVEGAELEVLQGMKKTIKLSKYVLIECSLNRIKMKEKTNEIFQLLFSHNFYVYRIGRIFSGGWAERQGAVDILFKKIEN